MIEVWIILFDLQCSFYIRLGPNWLLMNWYYCKHGWLWQVKYRREDNSSRFDEMELRVGSSTVCVPSTGVYVIEPVGCHGYSSPSIRWTGGVVSLKAVSHLYTGRVLTSETVSDLVVNVILSDDHVAEPSRYYTENVQFNLKVLSYTYKAWNL